MEKYIDLVLVINLKSRPDRRKNMNKVFKIMGIPKRKVKFIEATTRDDASWKKALKEVGYTGAFSSFLPKGYRTKVNSSNEKTRNYARGQIGNFLSHLRCWSMVGEMKGYKNVLVLEDDVCPTKYWFDKSATNLFKKVKDDYQLIYIGDCFKEDKLNTVCTLKNGNNELVRQRASCNHACLINTTFGMIINWGT